MALTPEARTKLAIKKYLDSLGAYYFMPATGGYGRSGVPDFVICWQGRFIAIEAKKAGGKPTELQKREIDRINNAGGTAFVHDGVSSLSDMFDTIGSLINIDAVERAMEIIDDVEQPELYVSHDVRKHAAAGAQPGASKQGSPGDGAPPRPQAPDQRRRRP